MIAETETAHGVGGMLRLPFPRLAYDVLCLLGEAGLVLATGSVIAALAGAAGWNVPCTRVSFLIVVSAGYGLLAASFGDRLTHRLRRGKALEARQVEILLSVFLCFFLAAATFGPWPAADTALWMVLWLGVAFAAIQSFRHALGGVESRLVFRNTLVHRAVVVGAGPAAAKLLEMQDDPERIGPPDIELLGFFDDRQTRGDDLKHRLPYLGPLNALIDFASEHDDIHVYLALPWTAGARIAALLERLRFLPITVWLLPDPELSALSLSHTGGFEGVVMPTLMTPPFSFWGRVAKRVFDIVAGLGLLAVLSPLLIATAILIKLDSPGPILFRQVRSGQFGRKFSIYKFRSLHVDRADVEATTLVTPGDSRVSRVGRVIRKYSIDELPQLFNVLRGEMSLVGPRPHAPKAKADGQLYAEAVPDYAIRYRVKPGMTGWAQINGWRGETDTVEKLRKRVEFDFYYIRHWSFWFDLLILLRTVPAVILPKNNA